jgi:hypothetical protein
MTGTGEWRDEGKTGFGLDRADFFDQWVSGFETKWFINVKFHILIKLAGEL